MNRHINVSPLVLLTVTALSLLVTVLGACGVQPTPSGEARQPLSNSTVTINPALRLLEAPTSPQATMTHGVSTAQPGSPVVIASPIPLIRMTLPPGPLRTPTPLPGGATLPPPPGNVMPAFPTYDRRTPIPTDNPANPSFHWVTPERDELPPRILERLFTPTPTGTVTTPTP